MKTVEIYTKSWCGWCSRAIRLLDQKGVDYQRIEVSQDAAREREMIERSGRYTVPQVFIDGVSIGGYDDLARLDDLGELDALLEPESADEAQAASA